MKTNELRIGNWYKWDTIECELTLTDFHNMEFENDIVFQPIPLTEEWLLRFGFEKLTEKGSGFKSTSYTYTGKVALIVHFDGVRLSVNFWQGNEKKYVHQLQNLYFALTGEELTLKEKQDA